MPNQPHSIQPKFFVALTTLATCVPYHSMQLASCKVVWDTYPPPPPPLPALPAHADAHFEGAAP